MKKPVRAPPELVSKTRMMKGYRCPKAIYLDVFSPELATPVTQEQQALFDLGNVIGSEARKRFPGGTLIDCKPWDFVGSLRKTSDLLSNGHPVIFEAAFEYRGCYARADIITLSPKSKKWTVLEVKSSTKAKPEHIDDIGLQAWIIANSGLQIDRVKILHLNGNCRYPDLSELFLEVDLTDLLREKYPTILPKVDSILATLKVDHPPEIDIGPYCLEPNECGFRAFCWEEKNIPEASIFDLPQIREKQWGLYRRGIISISDVPLRELNTIQHRAVAAHTTGNQFVHAPGIKQALRTWVFPLVFLDFETINPAIPRFKGCRPYDHVPFQFSVHIWRSPDSDLQHRAYLHTTGDDPRERLIPELLTACGDSGSIVSYYGKFETDRIKELSEFDETNRAALIALTSRIVDPLPIIRDNVYDPEFRGSFSLKAVAPSLLGEAYRYDEMTVSDGRAAQRAFVEMVAAKTPAERKRELQSGLLEYCKHDTLVMVGIVKWLYQQAAGCT